MVSEHLTSRLGLNTLQVIPILAALLVTASLGTVNQTLPFLFSTSPPSSAYKTLFNKQLRSSLSGACSALGCESHIPEQFLPLPPGAHLPHLTRKLCFRCPCPDSVGESQNEKSLDFFPISFYCVDEYNITFSILVTFKGIAT